MENNENVIVYQIIHPCSLRTRKLHCCYVLAPFGSLFSCTRFLMDRIGLSIRR